MSLSPPVPDVLSVIEFPVRLREREPLQIRALADFFTDLARRLRAGQHRDTGLLTVPLQRSHAMKIEFDLSSDAGKMWEFAMTYHRLPPEYLLEIAAACRSFKSYLDGLKGEAGGAQAGAGRAPAKGYTVKFEYKADDLPGGMEDLYKGESKPGNLLYSQAVAAQDAGMKLLDRLLEGARVEIAAGQRA